MNEVNDLELSWVGLLMSSLLSLTSRETNDQQPTCDPEEDAMDLGMHTFKHTHMRKAFQLMNDMRR